MITVAKGTPYAELSCSACHAKLRPGDQVLPSFRRQKPRAIHAHLCGTAVRPQPR
jgi:hypothetical protein